MPGEGITEVSLDYNDGGEDHHELVYPLTSLYTVALISPTITMEFGTKKTLQSYDIGLLYGIYIEEPFFKATIK